MLAPQWGRKLIEINPRPRVAVSRSGAEKMSRESPGPEKLMHAGLIVIMDDP